MEIKVTIDITDKTEAVLNELAKSVGNLFEEIAVNNGDFAKLAEGHQVHDGAYAPENTTGPKDRAEDANPVNDDLVIPKEEPKKETVTPQVITISKDDLHKECAEARVKGVNVASIIRSAGHADKFKNLSPEYYEAVHEALQEALNA